MKLTFSEHIPSIAPIRREWYDGNSAGAQYSLTFKRNGTVVTWDYNGKSQTNITAGLTGVIIITVCNYRCLSANLTLPLRSIYRQARLQPIAGQPILLPFSKGLT